MPRAEHEPETERRERGQKNAWKLDRLRRSSAGLEAVGGHMTSVSGEALDRKSGEHAGQGEPGQRPPPGGSVVPEIARKILVNPKLNHVDELEEPPRGK